MSSGSFSGNDNPATDIKECDCPVHIKTSFTDDQNDQDDEELSLYATKDRCWRDLLLSSDDEGEWEFSRRMIEFQKEQKKMSRPSSRASLTASMSRPSSRASSRASNTPTTSGMVLHSLTHTCGLWLVRSLLLVAIRQSRLPSCQTFRSGKAEHVRMCMHAWLPWCS